MEVPHNIENHRSELCRSCKTPCEFQNVPSFRREAENACPINRFQAYKTYTKKGLGDVVAMFAQPIAGAIDAVAGTKIKKCGGCAKRREALNQMFPFSK
jgi:hypothetical protein